MMKPRARLRGRECRVFETERSGAGYGAEPHHDERPADAREVMETAVPSARSGRGTLAEDVRMLTHLLLGRL